MAGKHSLTPKKTPYTFNIWSAFNAFSESGEEGAGENTEFHTFYARIRREYNSSPSAPAIANRVVFVQKYGAVSFFIGVFELKKLKPGCFLKS